MIRQMVPALALVALVAVAGCVGIIGSDGGGEYPPGVSEDGVENASTLVEVHDAAVNGTAHVSETTIELSLVGGDLSATIRREARVSDGGVPHRLVYDNSGGLSEDRTRIAWANDSAGLVREVTDRPFGEDEVDYRRRDPEAVEGDYALREFLRHFYVGEWRTAAAEGSGPDRRITLRADGTVDRTDAGANVTDYRGEVVVDASGRIRSGQIRLNLTAEAGSIAVTAEYELRRPDGVTVERPGWVEEGLRSASATAVEATVVGDAVEVTNVGREPIPAGHVVGLRGASQRSNSLAELDEPIPPGESVYLALDGTTTRLARSEPPDGDPLSGTYEVVIREDDLDLVHRETLTASDDD